MQFSPFSHYSLSPLPAQHVYLRHSHYLTRDASVDFIILNCLRFPMAGVSYYLSSLYLYLSSPFCFPPTTYLSPSLALSRSHHKVRGR
jgi:hypothetical protein